MSTRQRSAGVLTVLLYAWNGTLRAVVGFSAARHVMRLRGIIASGGSASDAEALLRS